MKQGSKTDDGKEMGHFMLFHNFAIILRYGTPYFLSKTDWPD
jgi:hypothetical protein